MVIIISNESDESTNDVIKYLLVNKVPFERLTEVNFIEGINLELINN